MDQLQARIPRLPLKESGETQLEPTLDAGDRSARTTLHFFTMVCADPPRGRGVPVTRMSVQGKGVTDMGVGVGVGSQLDSA